MKTYDYAYIKWTDENDLIQQLQVQGQHGWRVVGMGFGPNEDLCLVEKERGGDVVVHNVSGSETDGHISAEDDKAYPWRLTPAERRGQYLCKDLDPNTWVYTPQAVEQILRERMGRGR